MAQPYLVTNRPTRAQYRTPRRAPVSGVIVVHTAESALDGIADGKDSSAENVAAFIARRSDPGSYHLLVDSDSIVQLVAYNAEAYGDGTGSNPHAIHISFACRTTDWATMSPARLEATLRNGAHAAATAARWVQAQRGITVPARRVARAESERRVPGFISHAERDPGRRTDPGTGFPWKRFLAYYAAAMAPPSTRGQRIEDARSELQERIRELRLTRDDLQAALALTKPLTVRRRQVRAGLRETRQARQAAVRALGALDRVPRL